MEFEWDASKNRRTLAQRGFSFDAAALIFDGRVVRAVDTRLDYGEVREWAIGEADGLFLYVVFTDRALNRRIISARRASRKERTLWLSKG